MTATLPEGMRLRALRLILFPLLCIAVAVTAVFAFCHVRNIMQGLADSQPAKIGEFFALWSFGRCALLHPAHELYDPALLHACQLGLGMEPHADLPFPYPPPAILLYLPLGLLGCHAAYLLWEAAGLAAFAWASGPRPSLLPLLLVAPVTLAAAETGQNGFLSAAFLLGGLRLAERRPALAGVLLGLMIYKPQLALFAPVALLAARSWRAAFAAAATALLACAAVTAISGPDIWLAWLRSIPGYTGWWLEHAQKIANYLPGPDGNLRLLGAPHALVQAVMVALVPVMAILMWRLFRGGATPDAIAGFAAATLIANPHALMYDLPLLAGAVLAAAGARRTPAMAVLAGMSLLLPIPMLLCIPVSSLVLAGVLSRVACSRDRPAARSSTWPSPGAAIPAPLTPAA